MLTSKQRNFLRKQALELPDIIFIGKDGLSDNIIKLANEALEARELVKGKIQSNSVEDVKNAAETLANATRSEVIATIGKKFVLFRQKPKESHYELTDRR